MWVSIIGPEGSCRDAIAKQLCDEDGFVLHVMPFYNVPEDIWKKVDLLLDYYDKQFEVQNKADEDYVTVGTFWDIHRVTNMVMEKFHYITSEEFKIMDRIHSTLEKSLLPPDAIICCESTCIEIHNRRALLGVDNEGDEYINAMIEKFKELSGKIVVPMIDVDVVRPIDQVMEDVKHGVACARGSMGRRNSIWERRIFKSV